MNPDQVLLDRIAREPGAAIRLETSPLFVALAAELLAYDPENGRLSMAYTAGPEFFQGAGVVQGGIVGTMLDYAMGMALIGRLASGQAPATTAYTVNLIAPLRSERVIAEAVIDRASKRAAFLSARLVFAETGGLVATASSAAMIVELRTP